MTNFIRNIQTLVLASDWGILKKLTYEFMKKDGQWETQKREVYDRGNGATILLYNTSKNTVVLTRQFRIPTFLNGNEDGHLLETCAGKLEEKEDPEKCIIREVEEETGYRIQHVEKIFETYMSPGSVTELIYFFAAPYNEEMKVTAGGGNNNEQENIEVLEFKFPEVWKLLQKNEIRDAKTILLLQYAALNKLLSPLP
mgnify:FL=1